MKHQIESALGMVKPIILEFGDYNLNVLKLQKAMNTLGFYQGALDGYFGTMTLESLTSLQEYLNIQTSQRFDLKTWEALNYWLPKALHRKAFKPSPAKKTVASSLKWLETWDNVGSFAIS